MDAQGKRDSIIAVAVIGAAVSWISYQTGIFSVAASEFPVRGEAVSVAGAGDRREALVQLEPGGEVRAIVPPQCILFPGYVATVYYSGRLLGSGPKYTVMSASEKE
jgi:hypothetical protein